MQDFRDGHDQILAAARHIEDHAESHGHADDRCQAFIDQSLGKRIERRQHIAADERHDETGHHEDDACLIILDNGPKGQDHQDNACNNHKKSSLKQIFHFDAFMDRLYKAY